MSKMKSTLAATFLTLVLAVPALAGIISTPWWFAATTAATDS